jgi:hypothetical protein
MAERQLELRSFIQIRQPTMYRILFIVLAVIVTGGRLSAQSPSSTPQPSTKTSTGPTKADSVNAADIQRATDDLVFAVHEAVRKIKDNPELKVATLKLAAASVAAASVIVTEQATTLQKILEAVARDVAAATAEQNKKKQH